MFKVCLLLSLKLGFTEANDPSTYPWSSRPVPRLDPARWPDGLSFAGVYSDNLVLQREPQKAALYGVVVQQAGGLSGASLAVTLDLKGPLSQTVNAQHIEVVNSSYARWKAVLDPVAAGVNFSISAHCGGCSNTTATTLSNVAFGDVFFCSGQSNMWLPIHHTFSRNITFDRFLEGKYRNIRMKNMAHNALPDDAWPVWDPYIAPPVAPYRSFGDSPDGGWLLPSVGTYPCHDRPPSECGPGRGSDEWYNNTIDQFAATCWYFAQSLTDMAEERNETEVTFGLIHSSWGGTMVEMWQPNETLNAQVCKNASGGDYDPSQLNRASIDAGALWNGMVLPFVNMTIKAALWYQGENNVFQCVGGRRASLGDLESCGNVLEKSGYGCFMENLIKTWREAWSSGPVSGGTTPASFPFGIVTLAGGTSEGHGNNMGAFRLSQAGGTGLLPNAQWPDTFVAQAHDLGDPGAGAACAANWHDGAGAYSCQRGFGPFTSGFMGSIHPRGKREVGLRLALAARRAVYKDMDTPWTGPVATGCVVKGREIDITFDPAHLGGDSLAVRLDAVQAPLPLEQWSSNPAMLDLLLATHRDSDNDVFYTSPLEVQYGGKHFTDGIWLSAKLRSQCANGGNKNVGHFGVQGPTACGINVTTGKPLPDFNVAKAQLPLGAFNASSVTGIRYAIRDNPCCAGVHRSSVPCPLSSCPLQGYNSTLPAVPFMAKVVDGQCVWMSTQSAKPPGPVSQFI